MKLIGIMVLLVTTSSSIPISLAHHVESDDFDRDTRISLVGKVVNVEWINPHVVIHLEAINDYGVKQLWLVQADTPNTLLRSGVNRHSFDPTSGVSLEVYPPKGANCTPTCLSYGINITFSSGRTLSLGRLNSIEI